MFKNIQFNFMTLVIAVITYFMFNLYNMFLFNILIATLLSISMFKFNGILIKKMKNNNKNYMLYSSLLSSLFLCLILFSPLIYFGMAITNLASNFDFENIKNIQELTIKYINNSNLIPENYKLTIITSIYSFDYQEYIGNALNIVKSFGMESLKLIANTVFIIIFYFFINFYGKELTDFIKDIIPVEKEQLNKIFLEMSELLSVVMFSTLLNIILQGLLFSLVIYFVGLNGLLLGIAYSFGSLVPVIGGALIWIPVAIYEIITGNIHNAIIIALYTIIVISIIADTFIKPIIISFSNKYFTTTTSNINPLIIFFAILAGMSVYGFWGIILGPAITTLFISIIKVYKENK